MCLSSLVMSVSGLLWYPDAPNSLFDLDGLVAPDGRFYLRYDNSACDKDGATDPRCAAGPGGHCDPGRISAFASATSANGVHWDDHGSNMYPFDQGKTCPDTASGSGSVWRSPTNESEYVINYSDQTLRFMTASSPNGPWQPVGPAVQTGGWGWRAVPLSPADGDEFYHGGRWDTMNVWPAPKGDLSGHKLYGWLTVMNAGKGGCAANTTCVGFATSDDGVAWTAQPPAQLVLGDGHTYAGIWLENGGCAWGGAGAPRYYCLNAFRGSWGKLDNRSGQATFVSDSPGSLQRDLNPQSPDTERPTCPPGDYEFASRCRWAVPSRPKEPVRPRVSRPHVLPHRCGVLRLLHPLRAAVCRAAQIPRNRHHPCFPIGALPGHARSLQVRRGVT
jgi:hypothetical protein